MLSRFLTFPLMAAVVCAELSRGIKKEAKAVSCACLLLLAANPTPRKFVVHFVDFLATFKPKQ